MAAVHNRQHPPSRLRTSSDPFTDPTARSTPKSKKRPPPPPPKTSPATRMSVAIPKSTPANLTEAVRDTVTVHQHDNPRHKVSRSQTTPPASTVSTQSRPSARRSQSSDSVHVVEKPRTSGKSRNKKSSQHADVIDRLDYTGVGPMFHHDGPFDACAPSRNKHQNKAPMNAWGTVSDESSPLRYGDTAYPSVDAYRAFSNDYPEPPKKKVDAIAEAWGIHEPEPFEEFFAGGGSGRPDDTPASSIYNGKDSHNSHPHARRVKDGRDLQDRGHVRRSIAPPPQPIFSDPTEIELPESPQPTATGFPKRSKSLMQRIRKMRDAPNVPVGPDYDQPQPPSPSSPTDVNYSRSGRPTHRSQNSFLGRFGGTSRVPQSPPPVTEEWEKPEPYVFIEPQTTQTNKELPVLPASPSYPDEDFERLGRKTSIMKKVGRVVRGAK